MTKLKSINPATLEVIGTYEELSPEAADRAVEESGAAFERWRETSFAERGALMTKAAAILRSRSEEFARLMALEMGKPVRQGRAEIEKCAWVCEYYAERAASFLEPETIATDASKSFVAYRPLGVVLAVMPWNFPFWQVFRFAAPALMAGNAGVLKHASNVCGCALAIEDVFSAAGFPRGVFRTLLVGSGAVERLISHPAIVAVTLTGSAAAGRAVARAAGERLKKTVLELGGSDPYVVLDDADVGRAAATRLANALARVNALEQPCRRRRVALVIPEQSAAGVADHGPHENAVLLIVGNKALLLPGRHRREDLDHLESRRLVVTVEQRPAEQGGAPPCNERPRPCSCSG